ncbi:MAG: hypothetical protein ACK55I_45965, partial [bacterium]
MGRVFGTCRPERHAARGITPPRHPPTPPQSHRRRGRRPRLAGYPAPARRTSHPIQRALPHPGA